MGFVSIFDFINLKEGPTRLKHFFYYAVLTMEAGILMTLWYMKVLEKVSTFTLKKLKNPINYFFKVHILFLRRPQIGFNRIEPPPDFES